MKEGRIDEEGEGQDDKKDEGQNDEKSEEQDNERGTDGEQDGRFWRGALKGLNLLFRRST